MDPLALQTANYLVDNPPDAAGLEITVRGPTLEATTDCLIAIAGGDLGLRVNGQPIPPWTSAFVSKGWRIEFGTLRTGCRAYLAVAGGVAVAPVLESRSTYLRANFGGLEGRALQTGDVVPVGRVDRPLPVQAGRQFPARLRPCYSDRPTVAVIRGPQAEAFTPEGMRAFLDGEYQVGPMSDRMGYRLQGPTVSHAGPADILSDGLVLGAVQVPADQQPILMMADRQTTGGYPKIAVVARADIPLLAQCLPGATIRFSQTTVADAQERLRQMMEGFQEPEL
jgi:antagonist of KipI